MTDLSDIRFLLCDVDGVLTDGSVYLTEEGSEQRRFSARDGEGIRRAREAGVQVGFITRERGPIAVSRAKKLGIEEMHEGVEDKGRCVAEIIARRGLKAEQVAYIGDDVPDLAAFAHVGVAIAVANAEEQVKHAAHLVTKAPGGAGAVREVIESILAARVSKTGSKMAQITRERTYIIAEIGQNHQGDVKIAKELIKRSVEAGVDAVKSQKRHIDSLLNPEEQARVYDSPHAFGKTYGEHRRALELSMDTHKELFEFAKSLGIDYFCSPWDMISARELRDAGMPVMKIPSAALTHSSMLKEIAGYNMPVILSTGMSSIEEIDVAMKSLEGAEVYLLQCTSAYPCDFEDIHLRVIPELGRRYGKVVGFSGHHRGVAIDLAAIALGARVIERHFTLDRTWRGSDHAASLEPPGLSRLVRDVRAVERSMGSAIKTVQASEIAPRQKLRTAAMMKVL